MRFLRDCWGLTPILTLTVMVAFVILTRALLAPHAHGLREVLTLPR